MRPPLGTATASGAALIAAGALLFAACAPHPRPAPVQEWPEPDQHRPVVSVDVTVADDLASATGRETVRFTPDARICELVFRAWPNKPRTARSGNRLTVSAARVDGRTVPVTTEAAGAPAGTPGTLVRLALPACSEAGVTVSAELDYRVALGADTDERLGVDPEREIAWLGGAVPLLAWERGHGWVTDPAVDVTGDFATTETFRLDALTVVAPQRYAVAGIGTPSPPGAGSAGPAPAGTTRHVFTGEAMRSFTFTVGKLSVTESEAAGSRLHLALPEGADPDRVRSWHQQMGASLEALSARFGPVPYDDLWISVLPAVSDGVEFGGAVQFARIDPEEDRWLIDHELAHQWFHGLVGNDQATDPWLDEAFATYAQELVTPMGLSPDEWAGVDGQVGRPMAFWADRRRADDAYVGAVYRRGARALLDAREAAGAEAFDAVLRTYLHDNAHRIARPDDLRRALTGLDPALRVLHDAGAL